MGKPDFTRKEVYEIKILKGATEIYNGFVNEKAWNKTIENDVLWEYIKDNGRVIQKELPKGRLDLVNASIDSDTITLMLNDSLSDSTDTDIGSEILLKLEDVIKTRMRDMPANSYTTHLFEKGEEKILKKLGEEAIELILAKDNQGNIIYETSDLIYHIMVFLAYKKIPISEIFSELSKRMK